MLHKGSLWGILCSMDHHALRPAASPEDLLQQAGLRKTPVRIALLHALKRAKEPVSAAELCSRADISTINRVTVYRTLDALLAAGVVLRLEMGRGFALYELVGHHHHHFCCQRCKKILAVDIQGEKELLRAIAKKYRVRIADHAIELTGLCSDCQSKKLPRSPVRG